MFNHQLPKCIVYFNSWFIIGSSKNKRKNNTELLLTRIKLFFQNELLWKCNFHFSSSFQLSVLLLVEVCKNTYTWNSRYNLIKRQWKSVCVCVLQKVISSSSHLTCQSKLLDALYHKSICIPGMQLQDAEQLDLTA